MNKKHLTALIVGSGLAIAGSALAGGALAGAAGDGGCDKAEHKGGGATQRFSQIDTNKDGKVSLAELTASRESWLTKVDTNKDGVATPAEIDSAFQAGRAEHQKARFEHEDANKDGRLTRAETRLPSAWFETADTNKDGALTLAEFTQGRQTIAAKRRPGAHAGKGGRFDRNTDGKVDRDELRSGAAEQFARLDKNKDGSLTNDEFSTHGRRHRMHRQGADGREQGEKPITAPIKS
jgi:Ca2+-binding EF-hand superfamily protein